MESSFRVDYEDSNLISIPSSERNFYILLATHLNHEVLDYSMKHGVLVTNGDAIFAVFPSAQLSEVFSSSRHHICKELHFDPPNFLAPDRYIEEHNWIEVLLFRV